MKGTEIDKELNNGYAMKYGASKLSVYENVQRVTRRQKENKNFYGKVV
jgi:hypothetical protein